MATVYCTAINANQITLTMPNMMSLAIVIEPANWGVAEDNWPPSLIRQRMEGFANPDILCNDTSVSPSNLLGDPTETALVYHYEQLNDDYAGTIKKLPRIAEIPFNSKRKLMSKYGFDYDKLRNAVIETFENQKTTMTMDSAENAYRYSITKSSLLCKGLH